MSADPGHARTPFGLIGALYVSQAIPLGFFIVALPAILRARGVGLETIGLLSALAFPWLIKFSWAPLVDRHGSRRHGHFRSWLLPLQAGTASTVLVIAWLDPERQLSMLIVAGALFMLLSATQDIATDGLAVRALAKDARGMGNGIQVGGYYLGQILGGGVMLVAFARLGWRPALVAMAIVLAAPLFLVWRHREPPEASAERPDRIDFRALGRFFTNVGGHWLLVLLLYRAGETMAVTMVNPMLVDRGRSLEEIGVWLGVAQAVASLVGALLGGFLVGRLGRKPALTLFPLLLALAIAGLALVAAADAAVTAIYAAAIGVALFGGMATAALYTVMMDASTRRTAATDFTLQQSLCAFGPLIAAGASGFAAARFGYAVHFTLAALVALSTALLVWRGRLPSA